MKRAFTLIELLVIIGIMAAMVTASVVSVRSGQGAARVRGAARDIFAVIRHARSVALVSQQPAIVTYSCIEEDGEVVAKVEITSAKMLDTATPLSDVQTLSGAPVGGGGDWRDTARQLKREGDRTSEAAQRSKRAGSKGLADGKTSEKTSSTSRARTEGSDSSATETESGSDKGQSVDEILFAPISADVVRGMRIKVRREGEEDETTGAAPTRSRVSVFSNVDYLLQRYNEARKSQKNVEASEKKDSETKSTVKDASAKEELQKEVSIVWETNGRVEPHSVWVYPDGAEPESGLEIRIDRFGAAKVYGSGEERE